MFKLFQIIALCVGINHLSFAAPIQVDIKYLYYRNGWDNYKTLKNGAVLYRQKDFLKIVFTPSERAYVYIFAKGSSGNIYRIFPMQAFKGKVVNNFNPVLPGVDYYVPKKGKAFSLGGSAGKETLYFIVSKVPDASLESRYSEILQARSIKTPASEMVASRAFEDEVLSRDISDIVYDPVSEQKATAVYEINEAGKQFIVIRDRLLSCDGCVSRVSYYLR
ncbi:hypothetical protein PN36_30185 [Candidatus Thiomargarita nelsonii]|uniref:DUF4384 domain-containing protein n=1 Tax=Candidatus Thiomargarita nelsonii TaxID=1003181 RepID=A0A0A6P293_9GAMM|nr:hypothetical protein PN36_30185 [Candidatus Thiomargarita nelsonii]